MADIQTLQRLPPGPSPFSDSAQKKAIVPFDVEAQRTVWVALPAYNEQSSLPPLLDAIQSALEPANIPYRVIVVDDGSRDHTAQLAREASSRMPVELVMHKQNQGLAAAIRTGLTTAVEQCGLDDVIVTMDCDNTHPPRLIPLMLAQIKAGSDVVIASRFQPGAKVIGVPKSRILYSLGAKWMFQILFPIRGVRDYTCGYRVYRADVLRQALNKYGNRLITETGFSCMADLLLKLRQLPLNMSEVPLELRYDNRGNESKMRVVRTIRQTLLLMLRRRLGQL
ncbi:MAG TPA: glycosyltransferase family 2 protein [Lacipirellulaceae bacterium]|nr:glycosyltransferase family 2 protein [Lacipirellulaceae bacterium]